MIDIIVVTYNAKNKLKRCLESIEKYTKSIRYLLTVVNNNSTDGTPQFLKNYRQKKIKIINNNENFGFSGAANIALNNTSNKFIVFLDDDAEVTKGWLYKLYKEIKNKPKVGIIGCKIVSSDNRIFCADYRIRSLSLVGSGEIDKGQRDYIKECDSVAGTCWLMKTDLIKKVGYFDEKFSPSQHEDIDYCLRTRLAGYKIIYNGKIKIIHHHLFRDGGRKLNERNWRRFLKKWKNLLHKFPLKDSHPVDKYILRGKNYLKKKRYKQALVEFKEAESFDKRFSEPLYMGMALKGLKKFDEAIIEFKKVLRVDPSNFSAHYELALIYRKIGLTKEARREAISVIKYIHYNKDSFLN